MKNGKLTELLNAPVRAVIAVGLIIIVVEYLVMALFDAIVIHGAFPIIDDYQLVMVFNYLDPILLIAIVSPALYFLFFRPMRRQQAKLEDARKKINEAFQEWIAALDAVNDPIFLHDKDFRILRCNKAYQQCARIPFHEIIGQPYYEIFPKTGAPLSCCLRAMEKAEEEVTAGEAIYRSRAYSIKDEQGVYLYSVHTLEDITISRRAEVALYESGEKFRKITESAQDAIIMMGADRRTSLWNTAATRIFGYTSEEALGKEMHTLIAPPQAHAAFAQGFTHFQATGEGPVIGKVIEVSALRKGGEEFPVELSISATQLGGQWHAIGIVRDITERKQAEAQLKNSEERYRQIVQTSMDAFVIADTQGRFLDVNDANCQLIGYAREELLNMRITDVEAQETPEETAQHIQEIMRQGHGRFETRHRRKDGQLLDIEVSIVYRSDEEGRFFVFLRDITERKRAEEELRLRAQLLDSTADSIFVHDFDGNFVYMNEAGWKTRGYTRDELMGMNLHVLDTPEYEKLIEPRIRELMEKGNNLFEAAHRRKDGSVMPVEISARIIESGGHRLVIATVRDVSERKRAEAALSEQLEELRGWHDVTLGREMRVLELKREVDELLAQSGQPPRYPNAESEG